MKKKNGFTLVELLAVIVVLAIIMILAIPSVLDVMNQARKKLFSMYAQKVVLNTQEQYVYDSNSGAIAGAGFYVYDIQKDLGYSGTGSYKGFVIVNAMDVDDVKYIIELYDDNYILHNYNINDYGMPTPSTPQITTYGKGTTPADHPYTACHNAGGTSCYTRNGWLIQAP